MAMPAFLNADMTHVLTVAVYICRVVAMTLARKCSRQTLALLAALMEQPRTWQHGYELSKATGLKSGTLYPILIRLSDQGFLDSSWKDAERPGRPPRHVYRLTANGLALAREQMEVLADSKSGLRPIKAGAR
jgi:PadR family transcriptional regulator, regulatory protein PadR